MVGLILPSACVNNEFPSRVSITNVEYFSILSVAKLLTGGWLSSFPDFQTARLVTFGGIFDKSVVIVTNTFSERLDGFRSYL